MPEPEQPQEFEISQEKIVEKILADLNKLDSNKDRNEYIAGVLASFQMQSLTVANYMSYVREWIADNIGEVNVRTGKKAPLLDPDEFIMFHQIEDKAVFKEWFKAKRGEQQEQKPKIILLNG